MGVVMSPTHTQNHTLMSMHTHWVFTLEKWFLNCLMRKVGPLSYYRGVWVFTKGPERPTATRISPPLPSPAKIHLPRTMSIQSCLILWDPMDCSPSQAPQSRGFSRQQYWNGLPCPPPRLLPDPGIQPMSLMSPALGGGIFTTNAIWEALSQGNTGWGSVWRTVGMRGTGPQPSQNTRGLPVPEARLHSNTDWCCLVWDLLLLPILSSFSRIKTYIPIDLNSLWSNQHTWLKWFLTGGWTNKNLP